MTLVYKVWLEYESGYEQLIYTTTDEWEAYTMGRRWGGRVYAVHVQEVWENEEEEEEE